MYLLPCVYTHVLQQHLPQNSTKCNKTYSSQLKRPTKALAYDNVTRYEPSMGVVAETLLITQLIYFNNSQLGYSLPQDFFSDHVKAFQSQLCCPGL